MTSLTKNLLSQHPDLFKTATQHPFLVAAGEGTLSPETLTAWLVQDEHYQHAYITFVGHLMGKLNLPSSIKLGGQNNSLQHRILDALTGAAQNLRREETFYAEVVQEYGLTEYVKEAPPNGATQAYLDLFESTGTKGSLLEGVALLWATETVYLKAWQFAGSESKSSSGGGDAASRAVKERFISNWTNEEFVKVVDGLGDLMNELYDKEVASLSNAEDKCSAVWTKVLKLEGKFWPEV